MTIADLDDYAFELPVPITARIALGHGTVQSIEREVKLLGPIRAKGMVTLGESPAHSIARLRGPLLRLAPHLPDEGHDATSDRLARRNDWCVRTCSREVKKASRRYCVAVLN